jgi:hypothetical protein
MLFKLIDHTYHIMDSNEQPRRVIASSCSRTDVEELLRLFRPMFTHDLQTRSINPFRNSRPDRVMGGLTRLHRVPPGSLSFVRPRTVYTRNMSDPISPVLD